MHSGVQRDSCPLLNDYKQQFLHSRLPQTLSGGVRFKTAPRQVIISQLLLLTTPVYLCALSVIIHQYTGLPTLLLNGCIGLLLFLFFASLNCIPRSKKQIHTEKKGFSLEEENEIEIDGFISWSHFAYLFPVRGTVWSRVADPALYGLLFCIGSEIFRQEYLVSRCGVSQGVYVVCFVLSWASLSTGMYSLVGNGAPEVAVWRSRDVINRLYRPFYLLLFTCLILGLQLRYPDVDETYVYHILITLYILLSALFVLFLIGIAPQIDCLFSHKAEWLLVNICGASPAPDDLRLIVELLVTLVLVVISYLVPFKLVFVSVTTAAMSVTMVTVPEVYARPQKWLCLLACSVVPSALVSALVAFFIKPDTISGSMVGTEVLLIVVLVVHTALVQIQQVYVVCGALRNPLYRPLQSVLPQLLLRILSGVFTLLVIPIALLYYYCTLLYPGESTLPAYSVVLLFYVFRRLWQNTTAALQSTVIFALVRVHAAPLHLAPQLSAGPLLALFVCGFALQTAVTFTEKLLFCLKLQLDFVLLKKQRRTSTTLITLLNILSLPLILAVLLLSSLTTTPLLPLFSLPLFYLSFGRPERFWPSPTTPNYSTSPDSSYYKQISRHVVCALQRTFCSRRPPRAGSFILARVESLLLVVRVMQSGYGAFNCIVKGLELQETSCHTEEVNVVKDIFDNAFSETTHQPVINPYYLHTLQPLAQQDVTTYSDARNVLTGILDSPDCLGKIRGSFIRCLVYVLCTEYPDIAGVLRYTSTAGTGTSGATGAGGGSGTATSRPAGGFDFSGFKQNVQKMASIEVLEDTDNGEAGHGTGHVSHFISKKKKKESDFLDGLSFGSDDSWGAENISNYGNNIIVNKNAPHNHNNLNHLNSNANNNKDNPGDTHYANSSVARDAVASPYLTTRDTLHTSPDAVTSPYPTTSTANHDTAVPISSPTVRTLPVSSPTVTTLPVTGDREDGSPATTPLQDAGTAAAGEDWLNLPYSQSTVDSLSDNFPEQFYKELAKDMSLSAESYCKIKSVSAVTCQIVDGHLDKRGIQLTPYQVVRNYNGGFEWSSELGWLHANTTLHRAATTAYRLAVKLSIDEVVYGGMEDDTCSHGNSEEDACHATELLDNISELRESWYIGNEKDAEWSEHVEKETRFLFSLGFNNEGVYCSRTLTLTSLPLNIGTLNSECVKSLWSSLAFELLYLTNDDEERYSIQAHPNLLRNLTIQAADLPLGYPLYLSPLSHSFCV